jgi:hypothetical protein
VQRQCVDQPGVECRADRGAAAHEDDVEFPAAVRRRRLGALAGGGDGVGQTGDDANVQSRPVSRTDSGGELVTTTNAGLPTSPAP